MNDVQKLSVEAIMICSKYNYTNPMIFNKQDSFYRAYPYWLIYETDQSLIFSAKCFDGPDTHYSHETVIKFCKTL